MVIRLEYPTPYHPEYQQIIATVLFLREQGVTVQRKHGVEVSKPITTHPKAAITGATVPLLPEGRFTVSYGCIKKKCYAWFKFNPTKLGKAGMNFMATYIGHSMMEKGASTLLDRGLASHLEIAVDIDGVEFDDHCFLDPTLRSEQAFWLEGGTLYLGSKLRYLSIYDKRRELKKKSGVDLGHPRLRIEHVANDGRKYPCEGLEELSNPFSSLIVVRRQELISGPFDVHLSGLRGRIKAKSCSLPIAYYSLKPAERKIALVGLPTSPRS